MFYRYQYDLRAINQSVNCIQKIIQNIKGTLIKNRSSEHAKLLNTIRTDRLPVNVHDNKASSHFVGTQNNKYFGTTLNFWRKKMCKKNKILTFKISQKPSSIHSEILIDSKKKKKTMNELKLNYQNKIDKNICVSVVRV